MGLPNFHHHPDGLVFVRTPVGIYQDTVANFLVDSEIAYDPSGVIERYYEPGARHILNNEPQSLTWGPGDDFIGQIEQLLAAQDLRDNPPLSLFDQKAMAIERIDQQKNKQHDVWQNAYAGYGDWLAVLQAVETALRATRRNALDAIEAATTEAEIEAVLAGLAWPPVPDQATIEDDVGDSLTTKQEAKQFLQDNPSARLLLSLTPAELETEIESRTAAGETLLLKTLAFAVRYLYQVVR